MDDKVSSPSSSSSQIRPVVFPPSEIQRLQGPYKLSLFAKVVGRGVRLDDFTSHIRNVFNLNGNIQVTTLSSNFFLIKFSDPSDYENALQNGPWTIHYNYIALIPWTPNFKPSETSIKKTKVWIRMYELPVEYYDRIALSRIAEEIGPLVKIDPVTESMSKCKFARICVDLDLSHPLIDSVTLPNGFTQKVRYEGGLRYYQCWGCRQVGHVHRDCHESSSIATQEIRPFWFSSRVLDSPVESRTRTPPGESGTPPGDVVPDSPAAVAGSGFGDWNVLRVNSPGGSRIPPGSAAPDSPVAVAGLGSDISEISRVNFPGQPRMPPGTATPDAPVPDAGLGTPDLTPRMLEIQIPDQEATLIDPQAEENEEPMTPGSMMRYQVIIRGVQEQEVLHEAVEIKEMSNEGRPRVVEIKPQVSMFRISMMGYSSGNGIRYQKTVTPVEIDHTPAAATLDKIALLSFNCRGVNNQAVIRALKFLIKTYRLSVVVLTETRTSGIEAGMVIAELGFSGIFVIEPVDNSGGIFLLWDENRINIDVGVHDQHYLYALAQVRVPVESLGEGWIDVGVFGVDDV